MSSTNPMSRFEDWFEAARLSEPRVHDAMQVATLGPNGPRLRTVLCKAFGVDGFVFYTNLGSEKAQDLQANGRCALTFHWKSLERQVHVQGVARPVTPAQADAYFATRARGSQIGAWASKQSQLSSTSLADRFASMERRFEGQTVPRPDFWSGFCVEATSIEFWQGQRSRLHDRERFLRDGDGWRMVRLDP